MKKYAAYLLLSVACSNQQNTPLPSAVSPTSTPEAAPAATPAPPASASAPLPTVAAPKPRFPVVLENTPTIAKTSRILGWSSDGKSFGMCQVETDMESDKEYTSCSFYPLPDGKPEHFTNEGSGEKPDAKKTKVMEEEIKKRGFALGSAWAYEDVILSWRSVDEDGKQKTKSLNGSEAIFGAMVKGSKPTYPIKFKSSQEEEGPLVWINPVAYVVSPDGEKVAAVVVEADMRYSSMLFEERSAAEIASQAYNVAGLEHHKKKDYKLAAPLFEKAAIADPEGKWPNYNLACALALLGEPDRAKSALEKVKDPELKKKMKTDKDLDSLRSLAWFQEMVGTGVSSQ
jgi:hypothetical protein